MLAPCIRHFYAIHLNGYYYTNCQHSHLWQICVKNYFLVTNVIIFFFRNLKMVISCFAQNKSKIAKYFFFSPNLSIIAHQNRHIGFQIGEYMHNILLSIRQSSNFFVLFSSPDDLAFDEGKWPLLNCTFIYFTKKAKTEKEIINNGVTCGRWNWIVAKKKKNCFFLFSRFLEKFEHDPHAPLPHPNLDQSELSTFVRVFGVIFGPPINWNWNLQHSIWMKSVAYVQAGWFKRQREREYEEKKKNGNSEVTQTNFETNFQYFAVGMLVFLSMLVHLIQ